jgi:microsomal dipeptidase-like Zn-dependent dipeptidase
MSAPFEADSQIFPGPIGEYWPRHPKIGIKLGLLTVARPNIVVAKEIIASVKKVRRFIRILPWPWSMHAIENRQELEEPSDSLKLLLGLQHPPLDGGLAELFKLGVRVTTIAYEGENAFGAGWFEQGHGLSPMGRAFLEHLAQLGYILDLPHVSHKTARDCLEYIEKNNLNLPVMISHAGVYDVYDHGRNFPLDIIEEVIRRGGYFGLYALTFGLHESDNSIIPFRRHLEYLLERVDHNGLGIGGDGVYRRMTPRARQRQHERMTKMVNAEHYRARNPLEPRDLIGPDKMQVLREYMLSWGIPPAVVDAITGVNFKQFLSVALP